jgi:hypothetical protein
MSQREVEEIRAEHDEMLAILRFIVKLEGAPIRGRYQKARQMALAGIDMVAKGSQAQA